MNFCLFCGGDASEPGHWRTCDGRQGQIEAAVNAPFQGAPDGRKVSAYHEYVAQVEQQTAPHFNGPAYEPEHDHARLTGQILRIYDLMHDGAWRTLDEIATTTGDPPASISAQLRHLRKRRFGSHCVERRARGERSHGLWEYRLVEPVEAR